ncbi:MAG: VWA domain-containing protein [Gammaproteobacteria bacterium]|nr:VWA domain-containing protein [Gammaproteobacteria bacterium]
MAIDVLGSKWSLPVSPALIVWLALIWLLAPRPVVAQQGPVDLRVLVDVSGSMRKNDPHNLRAPALRLLVGLLPDDARAGIWTFGEHVQEAVPVAATGAAWKERARRAAQRIRSDELYTDIEQVLGVATADWSATESTGGRYVILLTDGMVDVGGSEETSAASRERIRTEVLAALEEKGATVHTIALSANADAELLEALARGTGGWSEQVDAAEQLNRVFLRLFEKTAPPDTVPLDEGNRFTVDDTVSDMTLLVFRPPGAMASQIVRPDGSLLSSRNPLPDNVRWEVEQAYDLVTINDPPAGRWRIDAATDPDNRVMVVTNLRLAVDPLPNHVLQERSVPVVARLLRDDGTVTDPAFLGLVSFQVAAGRERGEQVSSGMYPEGDPGNYTLSVDVGPGEGTLVITVVADGRTFARQHRHEIRVHEEPGAITMTAGADGAVTLAATLADGLMDLATARLAYRALDGDRLDSVTVPAGTPGEWSTVLPRALAGRMIEVRLEARQVDGDDYQLAIEGLVPGEPVPLPPLPREEPPVAPAPPLDWSMIWVWLGVANLILWPLVGLGWWLWRRARARRAAAVAEALA